jgi:hypothetical protein
MPVNKHLPMRHFFLLSLLVLPILAQTQTDTTAKFDRYSLSLQGGPPVRILSTDFIDEDSPGLLPVGKLKRYAYSVGGSIRYYVTPHFSGFGRFAYVRRDFLASDSTYEIVAESNDGIVHATSASAQYLYNEYTMRNMLIGLGGSYEYALGRMRMLASFEFAYVRYLQIIYNTGSRTHSLVDNDSLANANDYHSHRVNSYFKNQTFPNVNSIGLMFHMGMEYRFLPHFGISTSIMIGGFYSWIKNGKFDQFTGNSSDFTDSIGAHTYTHTETDTPSNYERLQFDFSPVTGMAGLNFYF